ncbi:MAG: hypothetical protein ACRDFX_14700, partial [Chloroflexota bacterium]
GFALFLDAALFAQTGDSLFSGHRRVYLALYLLSLGFWWLFEAFNLAVHNWQYVGGARYTGASFVLLASIDFTTVLAAVWSASRFVLHLLPAGKRTACAREVPRWVLFVMLIGAVAAIVLPVVFPDYAFGLIWVSMFLLLDPLNERLGRPSMVHAVWNRNWRLPLSLALGTLTCGFFWEAWNYWSTPKWTYHIPYVGFWKVFEMPILGYLGYLPFGLELFAMTNFVLPLLGLGTLTLEETEKREGAEALATPA